MNNFYQRIENSDPLTLKDQLNLMKLKNYTCAYIKENTSPIEPVKDPITGENRLDKNGNLIYPIVLDTKNIDIVLWTGSDRGRSIDEIISEYGDYLVLNSNYKYDEYDDIEYLYITIQIK